MTLLMALNGFFSFYEGNGISDLKLPGYFKYI